MGEQKQRTYLIQTTAEGLTEVKDPAKLGLAFRYAGGKNPIELRNFEIPVASLTSIRVVADTADNLVLLVRPRERRVKQTDGTYDTPGPCPKCGTANATIRWDPDNTHPEVDYADLGTQPGHLQAICQRCKYRWRIRAKDDIDNPSTPSTPNNPTER